MLKIGMSYRGTTAKGCVGSAIRFRALADQPSELVQVGQRPGDRKLRRSALDAEAGLGYTVGGAAGQRGSKEAAKLGMTLMRVLARVQLSLPASPLPRAGLIFPPSKAAR